MRLRLRDILGRRVSLPVVRWQISMVVLLSVLVVLVLLPLGGAVLVATNQPIFCQSCHEMTLHYATWSQSSHRNVGCEDCHVMPGTVNMFKSKINALRLVREHTAGGVKAKVIQGHVPDINCRRCHTDTPEVVAYHGLKIAHKAHWAMDVECTFCHERVVHGPKWLYTEVTSEQRVQPVTAAYKYAPDMETCYKCHDGKKASNKCSTCHVTLGERKPSAFDPAWVQAHRDEVQRTGEADCRQCHGSSFCENCHRSSNPHPGDWLQHHHQEARKNPGRCASCHLAPAEKKPVDVKNMIFCRACHGLRQEHKETNWQQIHGRESLTDPSVCLHCHTQSWCSDCHAISRPHPQEWRARHSAEANRRPESCRVCHTQHFCESCHRGLEGIPASHKNDWLSHHKDIAKAQKQACAICHKTGFCQSCHAKKAPVSHGAQWLKQHGSASNAQPGACLLCHTEKHCNTCHGMNMPHPKLWLASHHKAALQNKILCDRCHRKEACDTCHRGGFPTSHQQSEWMARHGSDAKKIGAQCSLCHRDRFCSSCHGLEMPHSGEFEKQIHGKSAKKDETLCSRCHQESQCAKCHGLVMPHPDGWISEHGTKAIASAETCTTCHSSQRHDCNDCHSALAPNSHQSKNWTEQHGPAGAASMPLCGLCHGQKACTDCHAKRATASANGRR